MELDLVRVATASFRTDDETDTLSDRAIKEKLGFEARYIPARLAIARSLSITTAPTPLSSSDGKSIKGDTLFGTGPDLAAWVSLFVEYGGVTSVKELQAAVGAHWKRGTVLIAQALEAAGEDESAFWKALAEGAGLPLEASSSVGIGGLVDNVEGIDARVELHIGKDIDSGNPIAWRLNGPGGAPHIAIMGAPGKGKTRTAVEFLTQIRAVARVPLLAFDLKGDLAKDYSLDKKFAAEVLSPPSVPVPLDVFSIGSSASQDDIRMAATSFRDAFVSMKSGATGAKQADAIREAVERALTAGILAKRTTSLLDVRDALKRVYQSRGMNEDGATARMNELAGYELFQPKLSPGEFFSRSWIVSTPPQIPDTLRDVTVNLLLSALDRWLNSLDDSKIIDGDRALRHIVLLDEAHLVFERKLAALDRLVRLSRSKGGCVMLLSQKPDDFADAKDEFLSNMGLVMAFGTNAADNPIRRVFGRKIDLAGLPTGTAIVRFGGETARNVSVWKQD
jgi:DNA sulfur modification protein DndE